MRICLYQPDITAKECRAVFGVLKTPYLALGSKLKEFEEKFAKCISTKYIIAINYGIRGLHFITHTQFVCNQGDKVIISSFSFIVSENCILYEYAK